MKIKTTEYENLYDVIVSEQVPPDMIARYFKDKKFLDYWRKRNEYQRDE